MLVRQHQSSVIMAGALVLTYRLPMLVRMPVHLPQALRDLAEFQRGAVTRRQALESGLTLGTVRARLADGRWQRIRPGVYTVFSGEPGRQTLLWAATLGAGAGATLSHYTAAELDGLLRQPADLIHVTVPESRRVRRVPGVIVHRSGRILQARHPVRTPPRTRIEETVLDLVQVARTFDDAFDWLCRACGGRHTTPGRLRAAMADREKLRWRAAISGALGDVALGVHSGLEHRYLHDVERAHGLPAATRQVRVAHGSRTAYRDALYAEYGVVVETDGAAAHPAGDQWRDHHRDNAAAAAGLLTMRYSWADISAAPCRVATEVAAALRQRGWPGQPRRCGPRCGAHPG